MRIHSILNYPKVHTLLSASLTVSFTADKIKALKRVEGDVLFDFDKTLERLNERGFKARGFETGAQAAAAALDLIGAGESVGIGGSVTVKTLGLSDMLRTRGNRVFWHWEDKEPDIRSKALLSDVYLCSANALTQAGDLISIDGNGNRVAAMFFGPKRCIIIVGKNKIAADPDAAIKRIKSVACPQNARRLGMKTPCAETGKCADCGADIRMCRVTVRYSYPAPGRDTYVFVVNEELGY